MYLMNWDTGIYHVYQRTEGGIHIPNCGQALEPHRTLIAANLFDDDSKVCGRCTRQPFTRKEVLSRIVMFLR